VLIHSVYKVVLVEAYGVGDFGQVYPIARGATPLLVCLTMYIVFKERLAPLALCGVTLLVLGITTMSLGGGRVVTRLETRAVLASLLTAALIASYTVIDGVAARFNGDASGFTVWMVFLDGLLMTAILAARRGISVFGKMQPHWRSGLAGGVMSLGAYWIVVWAATRAPIALVSALRETSVLFGILISAVLMREPVTSWRVVSAITIAGGIALTRA
jgi:drug/metabolite transporter (DMT)-like permease